MRDTLRYFFPARALSKPNLFFNNLASFFHVGNLFYRQAAAAAEGEAEETGAETEEEEEVLVVQLLYTSRLCKIEMMRN